MNRNILFVDDEQNVLDALKRQLRKQFKLDTALGPEEGLKVLSGEKTYAVIISDMRMPVMDGIEFLSRAQRICPDTVRMMLTGQQDQQTASRAINQGKIFRFLNKPCSSEDLVVAINAGILQYRLITAEKELLEETLRGSVRVLTDILCMANPLAFRRTERIQYYTTQVAKMLQLRNLWQYEVAAMLSQIGFITVPAETMQKVLAGQVLNDKESQMVESHPEIGSKLIAHIPRLESIAEMIAKQREPFADSSSATESKREQPELIGAHILRVAQDLELLMSRGMDKQSAEVILEKKRHLYNPEVLEALKNIAAPQVDATVTVIRLEELRPGMILEQDVCTTHGLLIVAKGQKVTDTVRRRLWNYGQQGAIENKVRISSPNQND